MSGTFRYRVHNLLELESEYELDRFETFEVDRVENPDITVRPYRNGTPDGERFGDYVWESGGRLTLDLGSKIRASLRRAGDRFEFSYTPQFFRVGNPEELIQAIIPQILGPRDTSLLNAAGVRDPEGRGILLFGPPQSGKTTTAVQLARRDGWAMLSDEIVFLKQGKIYSFPRPVRFRRDSPLYEQESSSIKQLLSRGYQRALPDGTRRMMKHLKHRIPGVNVGGTVQRANELVTTADRADLSACVFLRPTADDYELARIDHSEGLYLATLLSNWLSDHPFMNRYAAFDSGWEYEIPATDEERIEASFARSDLYVARAPRDENTSLLEERLTLSSE